MSTISAVPVTRLPTASTPRRPTQLPSTASRSVMAGRCGATFARPQRRLPGLGPRGVRRRRRVGSPARRRPRSAVPRGRDLAEPGGAGQRRRQGRRRARRRSRAARASARRSSPATGSATARRTTRSASSGRSPGAGSTDDGPPLGVRSGALDARALGPPRGVGRAGARRQRSTRSSRHRRRPAHRARAARRARGASRRGRARARPGGARSSRGCARRGRRRARRRSCATRWRRSTRRSSSSPGGEPSRNPGRAYGARTLAYVDCMRDLDVTLGPRCSSSDIAPALQRALRGRPLVLRARSTRSASAVIETRCPGG